MIDPEAHFTWTRLCSPTRKILGRKRTRIIATRLICKSFPVLNMRPRSNRRRHSQRFTNFYFDRKSEFDFHYSGVAQ